MSHRNAATVLALAIFFASSCEVAETDDAPAEMSDTGSDVAVDDAEASDASDAVVDLPVPACPGVAAEGNFALFPDAPDTQIHAAATWDGQTLWVAYNVPDPEGTFDVWIAGFDCAGAPALSPRRVNTTDFNDVDPAVAAHGGQVLVAWGTDNGQQPNNLSLRYRRMATDGTFIDTRDRIFPNEGNTWMPSVAPYGDGWRLAGVRAGETEFRVFETTLDAEGNPGALLQFEEGLAGTQAGPTMLVRGEDRWLTWSHDAVEVRLATPEGIEAMPGAGPSLGWGANGPILGWTDGLAVAVRDLDRGVTTRFTEPNKQLHSPVAAGELVAWYRNVSGIRNQLYWAGPEGKKNWLQTESTVAPYAIALADLGDGRYFLAWSEGTSPAFRIHGRILRP